MCKHTWPIKLILILILILIFLDIEKAYDMMWKEGLLIKLHLLGVGGRAFNWVKDFLYGRSIRVRIGKELSGSYMVEHGTPQGSVISPLLFIIMISYVSFRCRAWDWKITVCR